VEPNPHFAPRDVHIPAIASIVIIVVGMRRAGKTTFLWQILQDRLKSGTQRDGLLYFGFEDARLAGLTVADLGIIVEEYYSLHPEWRDGRRPVIFLDEIQIVPGRVSPDVCWKPRKWICFYRDRRLACCLGK
jgi:uncharacterized protein